MKKYTSLLTTGFLLLLNITLLAQDMPVFRQWLDGENLLIARDRELVRFHVPSGEETPYTVPADATAFLPDSVSATWRNSVFNEERDKVVVVEDGDLFLASQAEKTYRRLTASAAEEQNPTFSPDGRHIAYTRAGNLYVMHLETGMERQLTDDGSEVIYNGYASWVYYEEILGRSSRYKAFYWSPDSEKIAFLRFDDAPVPTFPIYHHEAEDMTHGYLEVTRYPKAGDPLPEVRLAVTNVETGAITWMDTNPELVYTAWVYWTPDADQLFFQQMNRDQDTLHLYAADPETGRRRFLYEETQPTWVTFFEDIHFLDNESGFILRSNRDGWYNLYHYDRAGNLVNQITDLDWRVTELLYIDEAERRILFEGTGGDGTQQHLFSVRFDGSELTQLTQGEGMHRVSISPQGDYFFDDYSNHIVPGLRRIYATSSGEELHELGRRETDPNAEAGIRVEHFTVPSTDGFELPAYWVLPPDFDESRQYPIVFSIYGGPDAGTVYKRYRDYTGNALVNNGVILFSVDHRASGKFGKKGLDYMHRNLGKWEMHDYIETVKWLKEKPFIDTTRIGIQGGSYGGYMTAMALTYGADYFTHGVSRAPVTDWRLYDNVYTERYMDRPQDNPEGYEFGSVMTHADQMTGELLLLHGTIDDNVHLQNTIQLVSKLQDLGKTFDLMLYPGGRHGWGGAKRVHSAKMAERFWREAFWDMEREQAPGQD